LCADRGNIPSVARDQPSSAAGIDKADEHLAIATRCTARRLCRTPSSPTDLDREGFSVYRRNDRQAIDFVSPPER
jgi:hypothetical protein